MKNGLTCECGNPKQRDTAACGRCLAIEVEFWRWLPFSQRSGERLLTESEQGARNFEARLDGLPRAGVNGRPKVYHTKCLNCGSAFTAKRKHAKTCGSICRSRLSYLANLPTNETQIYTYGR